MRWLLWGGLILLVLIGMTVGAAYWQLLRWGDSPFQITETAVIEMNRGESLRSFAQRLADKDVLHNPTYLVWLSRTRNLDTRLQAGEYGLEPGLTPLQLLNKLVNGDVVQYLLRIREGVTVAQMLADMAADEVLRHTITATDPQQLRQQLGLSTRFAEGMFFPDSYQFVRGTSDRELLMRAHREMLARVAEIWETRQTDVALRDSDELIVLASIIEKESGIKDDRARISQVFHNRLRRGMRLQTDPTVIYGLGTSFDGDLTRTHLAQETPYNTYRISGLPPTPIALPSLAALEAAANPAAGDYLYFVARGDGSSEFSRTLEEHNQAVRKYQLGQSD